MLRQHNGVSGRAIVRQVFFDTTVWFAWPLIRRPRVLRLSICHSVCVALPSWRYTR